MKIGKKIKSIFSKSDRAYVDMDATIILGIEYLSDKMDIESVKIVMQSETVIYDLIGVLTERKPDEFIAKT